MYVNKYLTKNIEDIKKIEKEKSKFKVKCDCGVTTVLTNADRKICYRCGHWIYKDDKTKFKYQFIKTIKTYDGINGKTETQIEFKGGKLNECNR